jgi:Na+-transporting NADH:ubiquinone oxidoreductase subunit NqrF
LERTYTIKLSVVIILIIAIVFSNSNLINIANAQIANTKDVFKVIVTLSGIKSSTKDILILVNIKDQTKSKLFNAQDPQIKGADKVNYTITFPSSTIDEDDKFTDCIMSIKDFKLECDNANNSPLKKPEFVDINLSAENSNKKDKDKGDKNT